ncbi:MAG: hypothetical protein ACJZ47_05620 [bacterium]
MENYDSTRAVVQFMITDVYNELEEQEVSSEDLEATSLKMIEKFVSDIKEQLEGFLEDTILIRTIEGEELFELKEGVKNFKSVDDYDCCYLYLVLTKKIPSEELDGLFLDMDSYGFSATFPCFPDEEDKLVTQGYDYGEYNTGYFSNDNDSSYVEILPDGSNSHFQIKEYKKAKEILLK